MEVAPVESERAQREHLNLTSPCPTVANQSSFEWLRSRRSVCERLAQAPKLLIDFGLCRFDHRIDGTYVIAELPRKSAIVDLGEREVTPKRLII